MKTAVSVTPYSLGLDKVACASKGGVMQVSGRFQIDRMKQMSE